jgi:hypothetical protein
MIINYLVWCLLEFMQVISSTHVSHFLEIDKTVTEFLSVSACWRYWRSPRYRATRHSSTFSRWLVWSARKSKLDSHFGTIYGLDLYRPNHYFRLASTMKFLQSVSSSCSDWKRIGHSRRRVLRVKWSELWELTTVLMGWVPVELSVTLYGPC